MICRICVLCLTIVRYFFIDLDFATEYVQNLSRHVVFGNDVILFYIDLDFATVYMQNLYDVFDYGVMFFYFATECNIIENYYINHVYD